MYICFSINIKNWKFVGYSILISCSEGLGRDQGSIEGLLAISAPRGELRGHSPLGQRGPSCCALRHLQLILRRSSLCAVCPRWLGLSKLGQLFSHSLGWNDGRDEDLMLMKSFLLAGKKTTTSQTHTVMQPSHRHGGTQDMKRPSLGPNVGLDGLPQTPNICISQAHGYRHGWMCAE